MAFLCDFGDGFYYGTSRYKVEIPSTIECNAISALSAILDRVSERKGDMAGQLDWVKKQFPFDPVVYGSTPVIASNRYASAKLARDTLREVEVARDLADKLKTYLDSQCKSIEEKADALTFRIGLESLPDNIVSDILELATRPKHEKVDLATEMRSLREARTLSHACQRFRSLILNNARIWNIISENMSDIKKVMFCVEFSKQAPLDVYLDRFGLRQWDNFDVFFKTCLLTSGRWNSLTLGDPEFESSARLPGHQRWAEIRRNIGSIGRLSGNMELPCLKSLSIHFDNISSPEKLNADFFPFWRWTMPKLVELELSGSPPPPADLSFSQSLEAFAFTCGSSYGSTPGHDFELVQLVDFISSCKVLGFVGLHMQHDAAISPCTLRSVASVEEVEFSFKACHPAAGSALCNSIHFPNATSMTLSVEYLYTTGYGKEARSITQTLIQECLSLHPRTTALDFTFSPLWSANTPIVPPITYLPELEELDITFNRWRDLQFWGEGSSVPDDLHLPPIRRLRIYISSFEDGWSYIETWAQKFLAQLKKQGDLETFGKLAIIQTKGKPDVSEGFEFEDAFSDYISSFEIGWTD